MIDLRDSRLVFALLLLLVGISVLIFTANYDGISVGSYFSNAISNTHKNAIANADVDQRPAQISPDSPLGRKCLRPGVINCFGFDDAAALYYNWPTGTACDEGLRGKTNHKLGNGRQGHGNPLNGRHSSSLKVTLNNGSQRGVPQMYGQAGRDYYGIQDVPSCTYKGDAKTGSDYPEPLCIPYKAIRWMEFTGRIEISGES